MNKGDRVKIIDTGWYYPTNNKIAKKLKAKNWKVGQGPVQDEEGLIINKYEDGDAEYYLVDLRRYEIVIAPEGIEKIRDWDEDEN